MQDDIMKTFKPQPILAEEVVDTALRREDSSPVEYFCEEEIDRMTEQDRKVAGITRAGWYFWNETWTDAYGPHSCRLEAEIELQKYCKHLEDQSNSPV